MTDPDTIAALGQQLGAKYVLSGKIGKLGNTSLLIISILKIDDLRQIAGDIQPYAIIEDIQSKLPGMAQNIIKATEIGSSGLEKLAVVPVDMGANIDSDVADTLAQILSINLIRSGKYAVYPRTETAIKQIEREYDTQSSGITADENVVDIGKGDNPRFVLSVAARRLGEQSMFNASIMNLESGAQVTGLSVRYTTLDDGIRVMQDLARELTGVSDLSGALADDDFAAIQKRATAGGSRTRQASRGSSTWMYGAMNLALGLGSFVQGDWGGGLTILAGYGAAAGLIFWELSLKYEDDLAGIPGAVGLGVAGFTVVYGFIRPFIHQKSQRLAGIVDGVNFAVVPVNRDRTAVRLSYTVRF
jgi:TolB-like protein